VQKIGEKNSGGGQFHQVSHSGFRGRLQLITDWESLAIQCCYSGAALARHCMVSQRQLQRHIHDTNGQTLGGWLNALRLKHGYWRRLQGCSVKETAFSLGYKQVSHFSRSFKNHFHISPSNIPVRLHETAGNAGVQNRKNKTCSMESIID